MGIVEAELASFELEAFEACCVERNSDGSVHLHMDDVRVELSRAEFEQFAGVVRSARIELEAIKSEDGTDANST